MEALISHLGVRISPIPSISNALQRPRTLRLPLDNTVSSVTVSYTGQNLGKTSLTSKVVLQKMGDGKKGFEYRKSAVDSKGDQFLKSSIRRKRLAVFVSGGGSNFQAIHKATLGDSVLGDVVVLVTDKPGCGGAEYARNNDIPVILFPETKCSPEGLSALDLVTSLRYSGPTVHFVDENFDTGRILAQRVVPVLADDTAEQLAARVLREEHKVYVEVVSALCEERMVWREDGVPLIRSRENPD